jgi:hypothetical protein
MIYKALAASIMGSVLRSAKKDILENAKSQLLKQAMQNAREAMLAHVAEQYSREVEHNISQYIQALGAVQAEVKFRGKPGEAFINRAESALSEFEIYLSAQNPDGAVIQFLQRRYKEEGIRIFTGRLYAGHYVSRKGQNTYEVANRMGYAAPVDKRKPWLTSSKTTQGLEDLMSKAALEIFEIMFDNVDLSGELATLKVSGAGTKKARERLSDAELGSMTRDQLKVLAKTKSNLSKAKLISKIRDAELETMSQKELKALAGTKSNRSKAELIAKIRKKK